MNKVNFISNPRICVFIEDQEEVLRISPDQIHSIIIPALSKATRDDIIIALSIFAREEYGNCVHALTTTWDGVCVIQKCFELYGDGSYDFIERDHSTVWNQI